MGCTMKIELDGTKEEMLEFRTWLAAHTVTYRDRKSTSMNRMMDSMYEQVNNEYNLNGFDLFDEELQKKYEVTFDRHITELNKKLWKIGKVLVKIRQI